MQVIIAYDITNDKRRDRVYKVLKDYGQWMQYSLFECELEEKEYLQLKNKLNKIIKEEKEDKILFYFLCSACANKTERIGKYNRLEKDVIII